MGAESANAASLPMGRRTRHHAPDIVAFERRHRCRRFMLDRLAVAESGRPRARLPRQQNGLDGCLWAWWLNRLLLACLYQDVTQLLLRWFPPAWLPCRGLSLLDGKHCWHGVGGQCPHGVPTGFGAGTPKLAWTTSTPRWTRQASP